MSNAYKGKDTEFDMDRTKGASQGRGLLNRKPSTASLSVSRSFNKEEMDAASLNTITSGSNQTIQEDKPMFFVEMNPVCLKSKGSGLSLGQARVVLLRSSTPIVEPGPFFFFFLSFSSPPPKRFLITNKLI